MSGTVPSPLFIDGPKGRLFAVYYPPSEPGRPAKPAVLFLPAFAEEMNRARRMAAVQARALAERGLGALVLDLYGTGDSAGDFAEARWPIWCDDAAVGLAWLRERGHQDLALLGLRLGGALAMAVAARERQAVSRLILWNPTVRGDLLLNQFLRVRTLAGLGLDGGGGETAKDLRERLFGGETLEIAGYALAPDLAREIDGLRLDRLAQGVAAPLHWFELAGTADAPLAPASAAAIDGLRQSGLSVTAESVVGEPFWTIEETVLAPDLVARTATLWTQ